MSSIAAVEVDNSDQTRQVKWTAMGNADTGLPAAFGQFPDRTLGVVGTFGSATVTFEGSFDGGTTWVGLHDFTGATISVTSASILLVAENPTLVRPKTTGGSGTALDVYLIGSRA